MGQSLDVRRARFGALVARALRQAQERGMSVAEIAAVTGVGKSTIYRWRDGGWTRDPRATEVKDFCAGLGVPLEVARRALGWTEAATVDAEPITDPLLLAVARRLEDPSLSAEQRWHIRQTLAYLAGGEQRAG